MDQTGPRTAAVRTGGALLLLLAEGLLLGLRFDSASLLSSHNRWAAWLQFFGWVMPIAAASLTAALLVAGPRLHSVLAGVSDDIAPLSGRRVILLALHFLGFAGVYIVARVIFEGPLASERLALAITGWLALCGLTSLAWLLWALPSPVLRTAMREVGPLLLAALLIGLAAWAAGRYTQSWWGLLRGPTLTGVITLLRPLDSTAWAEPARLLIGSGNFTAQIAPHCSGAEGIGLITVFLGAYFWFFREQFRLGRVLWLIPLGWAAAWATNVIRIALLVWIGGHVSPGLAAGGFHSYAGPLLFSAVALGIAGVSRMRPFRADLADADSDALVNPAAPFLVPFLAMVAAGLLTGLLATPATRPFAPGAHAAVALFALACFRRRYRESGLLTPPTLAGVAAGAAAFVIWVALARQPPDVDLQRLAPPEHLRTLWFTLRAIDYILLVPVVEELAFRGYLARRLITPDFDQVPPRDLSWFAIACSAVLFGLLHAQWAAGALAGLAFGWAARHSGRLTDAVAAHCVCNALLTAYALSTGAWWTWT